MVQAPVEMPLEQGPVEPVEDAMEQGITALVGDAGHGAFMQWYQEAIVVAQQELEAQLMEAKAIKAQELSLLERGIDAAVCPPISKEAR